MSSDLNRRLKRWPGWLLLVFVLAGFLAVGATRSSGPLTQDDRVDGITQRLACPICDGESVFVSQNNASQAIRNQVGDLVAENDLSDSQIIAFIETRYGAKVLLVPKASGFDALVWVLPAVALVCALAGLVLAFRRWKRDADGMAEATAEDYALVAAAMHGGHEPGGSDPVRSDQGIGADRGIGEGDGR